MEPLPPSHFLSLPRPEPALEPELAPGMVDTTTLAAHDFDVDPRTGFMPPEPPLARLPDKWAPWEDALDDAVALKLQLATKVGITEEEVATASAWRVRVEQIPVLPVKQLATSEILLRRAHHVLAWVMHFYIHTLPPSAFPSADSAIHIPAPISLPHLQICRHLALPPVLTYSDDVLYNWTHADPATAAHALPTPDNLRCTTLFSGTRDEEAFYLASARIELRGARALALMRAIMDEAFVGDALARRRIAVCLRALAVVIDEMAITLLAVRDGCDPDVFYNHIRPWFRGEDSGARKWVFDGLDAHPELGLVQPAELSGPSAGQSSIVHALDVFLGVDEYSHSAALTGRSAAPSYHGAPSSASAAPPLKPFLTRMQSYMPRHHRAFLAHLAASPRPLRALVAVHTAHGRNPELRDAYNAAVSALRAFRDGHMRIVALYIVGPSRAAAAAAAAAAAPSGAEAEVERSPEDESKGRWLSAEEDAEARLKGTGGTELVKFLKGVRDRTAGAVMADEDAV